MMYELDLNHVEQVSAGSSDEVIGGCLVLAGAMVLAMIASVSVPRRGLYCRTVETPFTEVTPVYDPYTGVYLGDQINSYVKTEQVCS